MYFKTGYDLLICKWSKQQNFIKPRTSQYDFLNIMLKKHHSCYW